jgi:hypothetical protein
MTIINCHPGGGTLIGNSDINDFEKDKIWYGFIDVLFSEGTDEDGEDIVDIEEIIYASSYISMNFYVLNEKVRNTLMERFNRITESQLLRFFEVIDCLFEDEDDRETELILLLQLLQSMPSVRTQAVHILEEGNLTQNWKNIAALVAGLMYEDDMSDIVSMEGNINDLQQENVKWEKPEGIDDEDIPF